MISPDTDLDLAIAAVFATPAGARLLAHLERRKRAIISVFEIEERVRRARNTEDAT